jgi:cyanophycin synthetase
VAYFSRYEDNPVIQDHCHKGGVACICENGFITIKRKDWKIRVHRISLIPLTFGGTVSFMIENVMAATLAAYLWGVKTEDIKIALETFIPSPAQTPGRMNIFEFRDFRFMIDFAHNPDGYRGVRDFVKTIDSPQKIGLIAGTGDRRDEDLRDLGRLAAEMFDHILLRQEDHLRGRTRENIMGLIKEGIHEVNPDLVIDELDGKVDAIRHAMSLAKPGAFITVLSDAVSGAIGIVQDYQDRERRGEFF